ncbi:MAG: hypothetical protein U1G07_22750 [Verrucomicrobiota bacterium]
MNLDEAQKKKVSEWLSEGLKLSDIQKRIASEFGLTMTYMEVRFLVDDLKLTPKDVDPPKTPELGRPESQPTTDSKSPASPGPKGAPAPTEPAKRPPGAVSVKVDAIARPGTVASGNVTFSDGNMAEWYLDQMGRLGLLPKQQGYRPSQTDVMAFQTQLQDELSRMGL